MSKPRPAGTVAAASFGDLVCGLASPYPPQPYVGMLGGPMEAATQSVVGGLLRAAKAPTRSRPQVKIDGRTLGTTAELVQALPGSPSPGVARMLTGVPTVRVAGQPVTLQSALAHVMPQSIIADLGGGQTVVRIRSAATQKTDPPDGFEVGGGAGLEDARQSVPPRVSFEPASALHAIVSQTSAGRQLDLASGAYEMLIGDPVDVVTGSVVTRATDFAQPWPPVRLRRRYDSRRSGRCSALGHGWTHELDQAVWIEPGRVVLRDADGREREFSTMDLPGRACRPGDVLFDAPRRLRLRCVAAGQYEISDGRSIRQFATRDPESTRGVTWLTRLVDRDGAVIELLYAARTTGATRGAEASRAAEAARIAVDARLAGTSPAGAPVPAAAPRDVGPGPTSAVLIEVRVDGAPVLRLEHDGTGLLRRLTSVSPEGELVEASYQYSAERDLVQVTDGEGRTQRYEYRGHLLVAEANRDGGRFHYGYDGVGPRARCVRAWGEGGFLDRSLEHDVAGGRTVVRDGLGHETIYRHDAAGLVNEVQTADGQTVGYRYDDHLRLVEVSWPDGTRATAEYDAAGNLVRRTERDGATWTMEHDARGHLVKGTDPLGGTWRFQHDERGRLRQVQDSAGNLTLFELQRGACRVLDPTGHGVTIGLDGSDRITEIPAPDGTRIRFAYDHRGRLAAAWGDTQRKPWQAQWRYDRANRLVRRDGPVSRTTWRRSGEGEVTAIEHDGRAARIERDAFGIIRSIHAGDRAVSYVHDREGRLVQALDGGTELLSLEHGADGHVQAFVAKDLPHGEVRRQPRSGRIASVQLGEDRIELEHDAGGRITAIDRGEGRRSTFAYRADGHLVAATNEHVTCTFERDPRGAVTEQRWGDVVVGEASPDHRGRRGGLRLQGRGRVSYLRSREGAVERIAVFAETDPRADAWVEPHELAPSPSPDAATVPVPSFEIGTVDALGRPLSTRGPGHVVWDEDRCVAVGDVLLVHDPDDGRPLYAIDGEDRVRPLAPGGPAAPSGDALVRAAKESPATGPLAGSPAPLDRMLGAAFPKVVPAADEFTPMTLLGKLLGHRAWIPQPRPVPGTGPWDPDLWGPRVDAPEAEIGRLDAEALLRALGSPFPRPELEVRSFDRRLPPPEPVP